MKIITNNQPRELLYWEQLSAKEQRDFDWMDETTQQDATFWRYRGVAYTDANFMRAPEALRPWDGIDTDTYFSATLVRYVDGGERVICGRCYS